jgi:NitT/TauT family transport system ATP-binding protein
MVVGEINPIPQSGITQVIGLLELLEARGGNEDGYRLAHDLNYPLSDMLNVMKAAEVLGFVATPSGDIVLEPLGKQFIESDINQRKALLRKRLKELGLFSYLVRLLRGQEDHSLEREIVLSHLAMLLPNEDPESLFSTIVNWGRFAELFGYNQDQERFYLDQE